MNRKVTERVYRALRLVVMILLAGVATGCAHHRLYVSMQPDGWSAQPVVMPCRFAPDADLDPATGTPVGDEGYYLYILTQSGDWQYGNTKSFLLSHGRQRWGHCWLILESPENRLECGLNGNFGQEKPNYDEGVRQKLRDGDPNPISYLWEIMSDGKIEVGNGNRVPTFVWRMPITRKRQQRIYEYITHNNFSQIGVRTSNCVDMVTGAAELAGISLIHRIHITLPQEKKILGQTLRAWKDPQYRILEYSTPDILEVDLRYLARFGIGTDVTELYLASKR